MADVSKEKKYLSPPDEAGPYEPTAAGALSKPALKPVFNFNDFKKNYFFSKNLFDKISAAAAGYLILLAEDILGRPLYLEASHFDSLFRLSPKTGRILDFFLKKGIFKSANWVHSFHDEPKFWRFSVTLGESVNSDGYQWKPEICGGSSLDRPEEAALKAIGEALERYSLTFLKRKDLVFGSYRALKMKSAFNPRQFAGISDEQRALEEFQNFRFNEDTVFGWAEARDLLNKKAALIPAQLIYLNYSRPFNEPIIQHSITTGAAAGPSYDEAVYRGLCENIERDAFMIYYLNRIPPPKIDIEKIDHPKIRAIVSMLKRCRLDFAVLDITTDIPVPAFLFIIKDPSGHKSGKLAVGAKAGFDVIETITGAFCEAQNNRTAVRSFVDQDFSESKIKSILNGFDFELVHRARFWSIPGKTKELDFFFESPKSTDLNIADKSLSSREKLYKVLAILAKNNYDVFVKDVSIPEALKWDIGVVKTLVPQLQPLHLRDSHPYLGGERLYNVPVRLGYFHKPKKMREMNTIPHPFT